MFRTLSLFLTRELLRVTGLALGAFTLVMTIFAIIEPLRQRGLGAQQVLALFGYTLPGMISLTLPIAALFAATIVYGRFAQDNELMACRASGLPTLSLLKPALVLGAVVTVLSLVLSNMITPRMAAMVERAITHDVAGMAKERLNSKGYIEHRNYIIHAAGAKVGKIEGDGDNREELLAMEGVVAADLSRGKEMRFLAAQTAVVNFTTRYGQTYATVYLVNPTGMGADYLVQEVTGPLPSELVSGIVKDNPAWYNWQQLRRTLANPLENRQVSEELRKIQRSIRHSMVCRQIDRAIDDKGVYDRLTDGREQVVIRAAKAVLSGDEDQVTLTGGESGRVEVQVLRNGELHKQITSDHATFETLWSAKDDTSLVCVRLGGNVCAVDVIGGRLEPQQRRDELSLEPKPLPEDLVQQAGTMSLETIYRSGDDPTFPRSVRRQVGRLKSDVIDKLTNKIIAEMHVRVSYSLSCFLMVALGAAMGLMFRGGQMISAFTLSVIPASVVIVLIMMGKQMIRNSAVSTTAGLAAMWSGIVILALAGSIVYGHLARK